MARLFQQYSILPIWQADLQAKLSTTSFTFPLLLMFIIFLYLKWNRKTGISNNYFYHRSVLELDTPLKNVLFWNCKGNDGSQTFCDALIRIINTHNIEIVGISECLDDKKAFVKRIRTSVKKFYCVGESRKLDKVGCIRIFSTLPRNTLKITKKKESDTKNF